MISKLATQIFHILRLIAWNPNFSRPKVTYFNVLWLSRQSQLHEVICIYVFRHTSLFMPLYRNIFLYMGIYAYCQWIWKSESMMNQLTNWHGKVLEMLAQSTSKNLLFIYSVICDQTVKSDLLGVSLANSSMFPNPFLLAVLLSHSCRRSPPGHSVLALSQ